jgi:endonuclease/exonuclease/phosphatase family metal-dependent hydrolase
MKLYVLVLASLFFTAAYGQQDDVPLQSPGIKILSWNIYMLPGFLGFGKLERSEAIGKLLAKGEYDVIVFQEAFYGPARKKIHQLLKSTYPFQAGPANRSGFSLRTNSGLWIFSKHPIVDEFSIAYETRYGIDAMSRKGALLVELDVHGQRVQVIATHLQNAGNAWRKHSQCAELFHKVIKAFARPAVPQIICGDFNIDKYNAAPEYASMLATLQATDSDFQEGEYSYDRLTNDLDVEKGTNRELIDFIFTRSNAAQLSLKRKAIRIFRHAWHKNHNDLSDHYGVEAEFEFNPEVKTLTASAH